jgi:cell division protein FtsZ
MLIKPDVQRFAKIKVVGLGGGGGNVLNSMINFQQIQGVEFIAVNTDAQALLNNLSPTKVQIGEALTRGLGSGGDPAIGQQAAEESEQKLRDVLQDADMVFLTSGMGGGTGTGAIVVAAGIAKASGALTVAVVTKPFGFEGTRRMLVAEEGIEKLKDKVDALIVIPNQRLLEVVDKNMSLQDAFRLADSVLGQGVQGISDLITMPGLINVDFADVRSIMTNAGSALMGIGQASGLCGAVWQRRRLKEDSAESLESFCYSNDICPLSGFFLAVLVRLGASVTVVRANPDGSGAPAVALSCSSMARMTLP